MDSAGPADSSADAMTSLKLPQHRRSQSGQHEYLREFSAMRTPRETQSTPPDAGPAVKVLRTVKEWRSDRPSLAVVMTGLPARGKTYIARRLSRYLAWMGMSTRWYNVGNYRRTLVGSDKPAEWFDPTNEEANRLREECAQYVLRMMIDDLSSKSVEIGVFDATNTTQKRRRLIAERCRAAGIEVMFVESICSDDEIIANNIRETKLRSPDYLGIDPEEAVRDFLLRIEHYMKVYETIDESDLSYLKYIDVGRQVVMNRIHGYLPSRICYFITHLHTNPRPIYLVRHGESEYNTLGLIGGDSKLSPRGQTFAKRLARFMRMRHPDQQYVVFTSTLRRTRETAQELGVDAVQWAALDELNAGICDSMTYEAIAEAFPAEWEARKRDKLRYRYPRGESYEDVIDRLETVIFELERQHRPVLVIGHQAVNRCLLAYFRNKSVDDVPNLVVPLHTVLELKPVAYGCEEMQFYLDRDDVENVEPRIFSAVPTNQPPAAASQPPPPDPPSC